MGKSKGKQGRKGSAADVAVGADAPRDALADLLPDASPAVAETSAEHRERWCRHYMAVRGYSMADARAEYRAEFPDHGEG